MKSCVAFVGVGRMGANMARRLQDCGYPLGSVFDTDESAASALASELSCPRATSLPEVTASADVILTVVSDDDAMREIFLQPGGLLEDAEGKTFVNCATLSPALQRDVAEACTAAQADALEACMASSITQARDGSLYLMIGGREEIFRKHRPLLADLSQSLRYVGPAGSAAKVKALVNMVMNCNTAALAEGLGLGQALGLDLDLLMEVFAQTGANSRVLETDGDDMKAREHDCYFSAAHAAKDSGIANALADEAGVDVPLSRATETQYRRLMALGKGDLDKSAVAELTFPGRLA